jgi:outer membrane lipoprotein SlyB
MAAFIPKENSMSVSKRFAATASAAALAAVLAGCSTYPQTTTTTYPVSTTTPVVTAPAPGYTEFGRISNIELVQTTTNNPNRSAAGTIIGGVAGGLLGNTIGSGGGRAAATVLGAVGGAVVGNNIANKTDNTGTTSSVYRVSVQLENGGMRTYEVGSPGDLRVGDRVRIENNILYRS